LNFFYWKRSDRPLYFIFIVIFILRLILFFNEFCKGKIFLHKISITHYFFTFIFLFILVLILSFSFPHKHSERYLLLLAFVLILGNAVYYLSNKKIFSLSYFFTSLIVIFPILRIKLRVKIFFILLLIYFYYKNKKDFYCKITIQSRSTIICSICSSFNLGEVLCLFLGLSWLAEVLGACWQSLPCVGGPTPPPTSPPIMPAPPIELQPASHSLRNWRS